LNYEKDKLVELSSVNIPIDVCHRRKTGCEENIKIKLTVPLLELLGYDKILNMDFEHKSGEGSADIGLVINGDTVLIVETKSLEKRLKDHRTQGLGYAFNKGVNWAVLTNGLKIELYRTYIDKVPIEKNEPILVIKQKDLAERFDLLKNYIGLDKINSIDETSKSKVEFIQKKITEEVFLRKLKKTKIRLFYDIRMQLEEKYNDNEEFRKKIDRWALEQEINKDWSWLTKMEKDKTFKSYIQDILEREGISISTPVKTVRKKIKEDINFKEKVEKALRDNEMPTDWLDKLASEGSFSLINRILFLRMCEDRKFISKRFTDSWLELVENSSSENTIFHLKSIFGDMITKFPHLYNVPLFDDILMEDLEWDGKSIAMIVSETMTHNFADINRDIIGDVYQHHVPKEVRKALGQFYTAQTIVNYILEELSKFISYDSKIIDPACGSGSFLLSAYMKLKELLIEKRTNETLIHPFIVTNCIAGIDIDTFAAQLTLMNIILKDLDHHQGVTRSKIFPGNSLDVGLDQFISTTSDLSESSSFTEIQNSVELLNFGVEHGFDLVIGNPPHGKVKSTNPIYTYSFDTYYKDIVKGVTNFASLFIKRGIDILRKDGKGYLAFVMPKSFTFAESFTLIREYIRKNCQIISLTDLGKAWDEVGLEQIIIILRKLAVGEKTSKNEIKINTDIKDIDFIELGMFNTHFISSKRFNSLSIYPMYLTDEIYPIFQKMRKNTIHLGKITHSFRGFGIQNKAKKANKRIDNDWVPMIRGKKIKRWMIKPDYEWINLKDPVIPKRDKYKWMFNDKIIVKRLVSSKVKFDATFDDSYSKDNDHPFFNVDTITNVILLDDYKDTFDYYYILGILNSNLMTIYLRDFIFNRAVLTMDLDKPYIGQIPIKKIEMSIQKSIRKIVMKIMKIVEIIHSKDFSIRSQEDKTKINKTLNSLKLKLNKTIYNLYELSTDEVEYLEKIV